jgi:cytochrome c oxidase subunit III
MPTLASPRATSPTDIEVSRSGGGPNSIDFRGGGGDGFGNWNPMGHTTPASACRAGIYAGLASISMLFVSLTLIFLTRLKVAGGWTHTPLPPVLYLNTVLLAASSATLQQARSALSSDSIRAFRGWLYTTLALGLAFIAGQCAAWHRLAAAGVYLAGNPSGAFFYVITAAHGLHLLGGIIALVYLVTKTREIRWGLKRRTVVDVTSIYWHFMDGLWIYVFAVLLVLRW